MAGGKHYSFLEVDIDKTSPDTWKAVLKPIYVFPLMDDSGNYSEYERRMYDDVIKLARLVQ